MIPALRMSGAGARYGATRVLDGIDLEVASGSALGVLGPNGSGKSTLVRACLGIIPHDGLIELLGVPQPSRSTPWRRIGYAPQRMSAAGGVPATAREVVASGLLAGTMIRRGRRARDTAMAALDEVGLAHRADESVHTFSGGQQQRVLLARALVRHPDLLFLDEPFAGVDEGSRQSIARVLADRVSSGMTLVCVLHGLGELAPTITHTITLERGHIVSRAGNGSVACPGSPLDEHCEGTPDIEHPNPLGGLT
ncbi:MAG: metal ABC transporter ATP-binding protein [Flaviflexus sp.]|nr:metal ABC transporter ATP-binding protein [Flaviflexus sp.]